MVRSLVLVVASQFFDPDRLPPGALARFGSERFAGEIVAVADARTALVCHERHLRWARADGLEADLEVPSSEALGSRAPADSECWRTSLTADGGLTVLVGLFDDPLRNSGHVVALSRGADGGFATQHLPGAFDWWPNVGGGYAGHHVTGGWTWLSPRGETLRDAGEAEMTWFLPSATISLTESAVVVRNPDGKRRFAVGRTGPIDTTCAALATTGRSVAVHRAPRDVVDGFDVSTGVRLFSIPGTEVFSSDSGYVVVARREGDTLVTTLDERGKVRGRTTLPKLEAPWSVIDARGTAAASANQVWSLTEGRTWQGPAPVQSWAVDATATRVVFLQDSVPFLLERDRQRAVWNDDHPARWKSAAFLDDTTLALLGPGLLRIVDLTTNTTRCQREVDVLYGRVLGFGGAAVTVLSDDDELENDDAPTSQVVMFDRGCEPKLLVKGLIESVQALGAELRVTGFIGESRAAKRWVWRFDARGQHRRKEPEPTREPKGLGRNHTLFELPDGDAVVLNTSGPRAPARIHRLHDGVMGPPQLLPAGANPQLVVPVGKAQMLVPLVHSALLYPLPARP